MALTDPANIPSEILDQIEAAAFDTAKGLIWGITGMQPADTAPALVQLAQGLQGGLTAIAMMVLTGPEVVP